MAQPANLFDRADVNTSVREDLIDKIYMTNPEEVPVTTAFGKSTATNTWTLNPEFTTNVATTNWFAMTVQSNRFINGTNEIFCGRPPGDAVFIRLRAQPNGP